MDDEPWGFAPFHYGRWAYVNDRWGWCPGAVAARVYYAPALVAFVGGGGFGASVSIGGGGGGLVGWFPLGPREAYYPSYHVSQGYIRQVNVTNTKITNINVTNVNVTNVNYANRSAMVAVPQSSFVSAQPVQRVAVRVNADQMRQAQVIGAAPRVAPQRESVLANSDGRKAAAPPATLANRPVVAKLAPPPPAVPFAAKQQLLQQHPGNPVAPAQLQTLRTQDARQNTAPVRAQVQPIDTKQVHPVTPTVRPGPAPTFAQRPAQPQNGQGQLPNQRPVTQVVPARPQSLPPAPAQAQPPVRQAPPAPAQAQPPVRQAPPSPAQAQPPVRQAPPAPAQAQPPVRQAPPAPAQAQPPVRQAPPAPAQAQPPVRQAPPAHEQAQPPVRQAPPAPAQAQPPVRQAPPAHEQAQPPAAPRPQAQPQGKTPPPPNNETKKPEDKKQ